MKHLPSRIPASIFLLLVLASASVGIARANCANPTDVEGKIIYNITYHVAQFCNGTNWESMVGTVNSCGSNPTPPPGSGFFVISAGTFTGSLGGIPGADAKCLSDLTANTGWKGYSTATANGQLIAAKVHALMCDGASTCNNLTALTTYYYANAASPTAGGSSFTTNASGLNAPGDNVAWSAANRFSGSYRYWSNMGTASTSAWSGSASGSGGAVCTSGTAWAAGSSGANGAWGASTATDATRWNAALATCDNTYHLVCFVNP